MQAAIAILYVDSLLIYGKIIRAFLGTTRYCYHILNNKIYQNTNTCMFLHKLVSNKDIIIDENTYFSSYKHLTMAKK